MKSFKSFITEESNGGTLYLHKQYSDKEGSTHGVYYKPHGSKEVHHIGYVDHYKDGDYHTSQHSGHHTGSPHHQFKHIKGVEFRGENEHSSHGDALRHVIDNSHVKVHSNHQQKTIKSVKELHEEYLDEVAAWQRKEGKSESGGLNRKGIESYRRENPGSKLSMAVTTKPSKLKPGSKSANRRKSFCARMGGMKKRLTSAKTANDPDSRINKALRKWNC